jgi:glutamine---fructose-6-phosphate transaminase (isomerizing)
MRQLERAIWSQSSELERLAQLDLAAVAERLKDRRRIWLVGTGSSQHVAELGALVLAEGGLDARSSGSLEFTRSPLKPDADDAVLLISHSTRTSFALAAREVARASGAELYSITGSGAGWPEGIETVPIEQSQTYTVSVTAALVVLIRLALDLGVPDLSPSDLDSALLRVRQVIADSAVPALTPPDRVLVVIGSGPGAVTAREGALKLREAARVLAEGYSAEYFLHGQAVPLRRGDSMLLLLPACDQDGLMSALGDAASAEGLVVESIDEPAVDHPILAQLPTLARLQLLALAFSQARDTNPDAAITGSWADSAMWRIGHPA